jgi:hypothetical protein
MSYISDDTKLAVPLLALVGSAVLRSRPWVFLILETYR